MVQSLGIFLYWWLRGKFFGIYARGTESNHTDRMPESPTWRMGRSEADDSIIATLDKRGRNRGLFFSPDMRLWCGRKLRVKGRLDKIIADGTGQMRQLRNTVCLEGSTCGCSYMGLGMAGCSRFEFTYWREIWLKRCSESNDEITER